MEKDPKNTEKLSLVEFAKKYMKIKGADGIERPFSEAQLNEMKFYEEVKNRSGKVQLVKTRRGTKLLAILPDNAKVKLCDGCGKKFVGKEFPIVDENFNIQRGLKQCEECYASSIK